LLPSSWGGGVLTASSQAQDNPDEGYIPVVGEELPEGFLPEGPVMDETSDVSISLIVPSAPVDPNSSFPGFWVPSMAQNSWKFAPSNMYRCLRDPYDLHMLSVSAAFPGAHADTGAVDTIIRRKSNFNIYLSDTGTAVDGDSVMLYFNGHQLGIGPWVLTHFGMGIPVPAKYFHAGANRIEVVAVSGGTHGACTPTITLASVLHGGWRFSGISVLGVPMPLIPGQHVKIDMSFPIVGESATGPSPEVYAHIASQINNFPTLQEIDRPGADARRAKSTGRYRGTPATATQELDEYPMAMFKENGGTAHVRPLDGRQNGSSGSRIGRWQCTGLENGDNVDFRLLP
jgi:hypothetical protein